MTKRPQTSSVAALVLARVAQRRAQENDDLELMEYAKDLESRALAAIRLHLPVLPKAERPRRAAVQLQLPGL